MGRPIRAAISAAASNRERLCSTVRPDTATRTVKIVAAFRPDGSPREQYQGENILDGKVSAQLNRRIASSGSCIGRRSTPDRREQFTQWGSGNERCCPPAAHHVDKIEWEYIRKSLVTSLQSHLGWTAPVNVKSKDGSNVTIFNDADHGSGRPAAFDQVTQAVTGTDPSSGNFDVAKRFHTRGPLVVPTRSAGWEP